MNVLFLDNDPDRHKKFRSQVPCCKWVETADECIKAFEDADEPWDWVFFDHDLSYDENGVPQHFVDTNMKNCGMEVVRWMEKNKPPIEKIIVHSHNSNAGDEMVHRLSKFYNYAEYIPFYALIAEVSELVYGP
tara:strand:+ start:537 stop:935 length:399 start_codon:yes stop_codon:yes gene_type:complete